MIYYKHRSMDELEYLAAYLSNQNIKCIIFNYSSGYTEADYLCALQHSKYAIILAGHESQGFAIEEAMACDVPLLVWNTRYMSQEEGQNYDDIPCTSIPYWDDRCGEYFHDKESLDETFTLFLSKLDTYKPRDYVLEKLSVKSCAEAMIKLAHKRTPTT